MSDKVKPIPEGYGAVTPYLIVDGAARAIEFYKQAFGAEETFRMEGPGGRVGHAEIKIGGSHIMLADEHPEMGARAAVVRRLADKPRALRRRRGRDREPRGRGRREADEAGGESVLRR